MPLRFPPLKMDLYCLKEIIFKIVFKLAKISAVIYNITILLLLRLISVIDLDKLRCNFKIKQTNRKTSRLPTHPNNQHSNVSSKSP